MPIASLLLFIAVAIGHITFLVVGINWLYGSRFRGRWVSAIRHLLELLIVTGPVWFAVSWGATLWERGDWLALPPALVGYLLLCGFLGFGSFAVQTVRRWRRRPPALLLGNHTRTIDVAKNLGYKPFGHGGRHDWQARLPRNEIFQVDFTELTIRLARLPAALDGMTILHLSDLHLCGVPDRPFFEYVMDRCAEQPCDLLALTGDVLDYDHHYEWIVPVLSRLRWNWQAFGILGNHDAWGDVARIRLHLAEVGITSIGGRWQTTEFRGVPLAIIGNEMPWLSPWPDLNGCPESVFRLCLSHSPDQMPWAKRHGIDLVLAGHNHGGQIRFPGIGPILVPSIHSRRYDGGLYAEPPTLLHVSRGLSGTHPLRYRCCPEVTRLILRSGSDRPSPGSMEVL